MKNDQIFHVSEIDSSFSTSLVVSSMSFDAEERSSLTFLESPVTASMKRALNALFITALVDLGIVRYSMVTFRYEAICRAEYRSGSLLFVLQLVIVWYLIPVAFARFCNSSSLCRKHLSTFCQKKTHVASFVSIVKNIPLKLLNVNFENIKANSKFILTNVLFRAEYINMKLLNSNIELKIYNILLQLRNANTHLKEDLRLLTLEMEKEKNKQNMAPN